MPKDIEKFIAVSPFSAEGKRYVGGEVVECREGTMTALINRGLVKSREQIKEAAKVEKTEADELKEREAAQRKAAEEADKK